MHAHAHAHRPSRDGEYIRYQRTLANAAFAHAHDRNTLTTTFELMQEGRSGQGKERDGEVESEKSARMYTNVWERDSTRGAGAGLCARMTNGVAVGFHPFHHSLSLNHYHSLVLTQEALFEAQIPGHLHSW
jgi:hypothetical protein